MAKLTATEQMEVLFKKTDSIREQYAVALQNAKQEVLDLTEAIAEAEQHVKEIYKHYVLNIVSLDAYQVEKKLLDDKKAVLHVAEKKIADIAELQKEELSEVFNEMKGIMDEYTQENEANKAQQRKKLFKEKVAYLKAINTGKVEIEKTNKYVRMIDHLRVEIGDKRDYYYDFEDSAVSALIHNPYNNSPGLDVNRNEIAEAYHKGNIGGYVLQEANK
ncbi:hypothetical protein ACIQ2D_21405 [Lysinibacillus sp. NPDC097287]|uniref:hypothetical protein n=1 Tax=Lysinibacillus sp. NPDC097287 TaxID=3364144 RepID=UPI0038180169